MKLIPFILCIFVSIFVFVMFSNLCGLKKGVQGKAVYVLFYCIIIIADITYFVGLIQKLSSPFRLEVEIRSHRRATL